MSPRIGRCTSDGTFEYYDNYEELRAVEEREARSSRSFYFGLVGLVAGGTLTYFAMRELGGQDWPKWLRFISTVAGAALGAVTLAKLSGLIIKSIGVLFFWAWPTPSAKPSGKRSEKPKVRYWRASLFQITAIRDVFQQKGIECPVKLT